MKHMKAIKTLTSLFFVLLVLATVSTTTIAKEIKSTETVPANATAATIETGKIDLNTATTEQLTSLPGIGPSLADRILKYRTEIGKFQKTDEILSVKGIGEKKYEKLSDLIIVR